MTRIRSQANYSLSKNFILITIIIVVFSVGISVIVATNKIQVSDKQVISPSVTPTPSPMSKISPSPGQPIPGNSKAKGILKVTDITRNRGFYVGKNIKVQGRIKILERLGLAPCREGDPQCSSNVGSPTLHLVSIDYPFEKYPDPENTIDLYRQASGGGYEPLTCKVTGYRKYDCGLYQDGSVIITEGRFIKQQVPSGSTSDGKVIKWQDIYFLAPP